jgi:hypothetical protein
MPDKIKNTHELAIAVCNAVVPQYIEVSDEVGSILEVSKNYDACANLLDTYIAELLSDPTYVLINILHGTINISEYDTHMKEHNNLLVKAIGSASLNLEGLAACIETGISENIVEQIDKTIKILDSAFDTWVNDNKGES